MTVRPLPPVVEHVYVSTYCQHGLCADCRRECKFCEAPCQHSCHRRDEGTQ